MPWTLLAVLSYLGSLALGTAALRGARVRRAWHGRLFLITGALTVLAAALSFPQHWGRGLSLGFALVPLALLPIIGRPVAKHRGRHIAMGVAAAPGYLAALGFWLVYR